MGLSIGFSVCLKFGFNNLSFAIPFLISIVGVIAFRDYGRLASIQDKEE